MITLSFAEIALATNGDLHNDDLGIPLINSVCTDSRHMTDNCLFIALQGPSFDAHNFIDQVDKVASLLLVHKQVSTNIPYILVEDTRIALGHLGAYVKQKIQGLKCAAITGSNGKTTTKELLKQILEQHDNAEHAVLATAGNFNNDIGLPLTLLRLTQDNHFAVLELGANHIGEIAYTSQLVKPNVALVNNVMPAHLEGFGSIQGVAKAKGEIWRSLGQEGVAVINLDDDYAQCYIEQVESQENEIVTFSQDNKKATIYASDICTDAMGKSAFKLTINSAVKPLSINVGLNIAGKHNISNALAAAGMAYSLGCSLEDIQLGLNSLRDVSGRVNSTRLNDSLTIIDDTYNANSASVKVAIDLLALHQTSTILVLGDMAELGEYSVKEHTDVGLYAAQKNIDMLFTVGKLSEYTTKAFADSTEKVSKHFRDKNALAHYLTDNVLSNDINTTILLKGSRGAKMEETVALIKQAIN